MLPLLVILLEFLERLVTGAPRLAGERVWSGQSRRLVSGSGESDEVHDSSREAHCWVSRVIHGTKGPPGQMGGVLKSVGRWWAVRRRPKKQLPDRPS